MTCSRILRIYIVTFNLSDFKIHPAKLDYISHTKVGILVHGIKLFKHLIDGLFFSDDKPHGLLQIDVVLFILFGFPCLLRVADHVI